MLPDLTIELNSVDLSAPSNTNPRAYIPQKLIIKKSYKILSLDKSTIDLTQELQYITVVFVNNILMYLNNVSSFNTILEDPSKGGVTAGEAFSAFEQHIVKQHPGTFGFRKVNADINLNIFRYEQIMIKTHNDLQVPNLLLYNYKHLNSYSFYFFDDFSLEASNTNDVEVILINLTRTFKFKRVNIFDTYLQRANIINNISIHNPMNPLLYSDEVHPVIKNPNNVVNLKQRKETVNTPGKNTKSTTENFLLNEDRVFNSISNQNMNSQTSSHGRIKIYAPDSTDIAANRFKIIGTQINKEFVSIIEISAPKTLPTELQFGYVYNFDAYLDTLTASSYYNYTPISIVNSFKKETPKKTELIHSARSQLLKFET